MDIIDKGIKEGLISFDEERKKITYIHQGKTRNYTNPEEPVQAVAFLKLLFSYNYPVERIQLYVSVTMGSSVKEADIVVYNDDECTKPHIVVECKKAEITELEFIQGIEQGYSYALRLAGTIKYLWVTSEIKNEYFIIDKEREVTQTIPDIPPYGITEIQNYKYAKGGRSTNEEAGEDRIKQKFFELEVINEDELIRRFKQVHQVIWDGGKLNPIKAFDEMDKLLFCKIWDERKPRRNGDPYDFQIFSEPIPENATKEQIKNIELKITKDLYNRIRALYDEGRKKAPEVFNENISLPPKKIKTIVGYLESISLSLTDLDSKGKAFETFIGSHFRGDFGQYFTPRTIVKFIVNSLNIDKDSRILDTSCGSGGFLLYALDKVRSLANDYYPNYENDPRAYHEHWNYWHEFAENNLFGIEINEDIARTAMMNMIIHDDGHTNVISDDGLLLADTIREKSGNKEFKYNSFDYIITNPPFGNMIKQTEKAYLHQYNLGNKDISWLDTKNTAVKARETQNTEILFIEQCWNFLKPGGFLAIVVPDGVLTNSSLQYVRDNIEDWYRIVAVISLPQTAFSHTGAGVKSSVMFLRKWSKATTESITDRKKDLQEQIKTDADYINLVAKIEKDKKKVIKDHTGFVNNTGKTEKKDIEKTEAFKDWKKEIGDQYNQHINDLKEELTDRYIAEKKKKMDDYSIFMAIAENIGYDATGKPTGNNELDIIESELKRFIVHIQKEEKI